MALTKVSYSMIDGAPVNVLDYIPIAEHAAIKSNTSTYDCTAAFKSAIGGYADKKAIYVPAGTYLLSDHLFLGIYKTLTGEGRFKSVLRWTRNAANGGALLADAYCGASGLSIVNVGTNNTTSIALCSWAQGGTNGARDCEWQDLFVQGWGYAVAASVLADTTLPLVASLANAQIWNSTFDKIEFQSNGRCFHLGTSGVNNNRITNCFFKNGTGDRDVFLNNALGVQFENCAFETSAATVDLELSVSLNVSIKDCYFEPAHGIVFDACPGAMVQSCVLTAEALTGTANNAFVRCTNTNLPVGWDANWSSFVIGCTLRIAASGTKYWVRNDSAAIQTQTFKNYSINNDMLLGTGAREQHASGSDANNGRWVRYADGTQICTYVKVGSGYGATGVKTETWTFPVSFVDTPATNSSIVEPDANDGRWSLVTETTTSATANYTVAVNVTTIFTNAPTIRFMAIGRWI